MDRDEREERERERERRKRNFTESLTCHEKSGGTSFRFVLKWFCYVQVYSLVSEPSALMSVRSTIKVMEG